LELSGQLTQTNNRGLINNLADGSTLTLSGQIYIWEDGEPDIERRLEFDGTGTTIVTGDIKDDPELSATIRQIVKRGTGVLIMDIADGNTNNHTSETIVHMGNMHYTSNASLNQGPGLIRTYGGAVGVDDQSVASNATFLAKIDPDSTGGLMLSSHDAAASLNFTGAMANAGKMSVAAPESGLTFTGSITPANNQYRLGGGTGTLTLPNAQLSGANALEVANGGDVELLGDNTYTGRTAVFGKYTTSHEAQAEADTAQNVSSLFYEEVAPTLVVDKLADGGTASSIGSSTADATNLKIQGATLKYVGAGDTTNRLFTIGTHGATLDASGAGALVFSGTGTLLSEDAPDLSADLDDFTGTNDSNALHNVQGDSRDLVIGMTANDPDAGGPFAFTCPNGDCIPAGTTVTGVSDTGGTVGLSARYGFIQKLATRIVFGAVERTLTLTGDSQAENTLSPIIADSAKGSIVGIVKNGSGAWYLDGANTNSGETVVEQGTLGGDGGVGGDLVVQSGAVFAPGTLTTVGGFDVGGDLTLATGSTLDIQLSGTSAALVDSLSVAGDAEVHGVIDVNLLGFSPTAGDVFTVLTAGGTIDAAGLSLTGASGFSFQVSGNDLLLRFGAAANAALAAVPEPSAAMLGLLAVAGLVRRRRND
ncbi:MAG: autotransporter-associated beta strand repeat-containing protein, partial [Planctomycetales bacterium]|nr:autotransporter-associated beta strand repeat-containing protein [Planctomycetales bacterium]